MSSNLTKWDQRKSASEKAGHLLKNKYPDILPANFCFPVGVGWKNIMDDLCNSVQDVLKHLPQSFYFKIYRVKEKFGGLRVHENLSDSFSNNRLTLIYLLIEEAEKKSCKTCKYCGKPGTLRNTAPKSIMHETLCDECNGKPL